MSDIGFRLESEDDYQQLALKACEEGQAWRTASGTYISWSPGEGIELWAQLDRDGEIIGLNPHFRGKGLMRVGLAHKINRPDGTILDGGFYGWANPSEMDPESGEFPLVFDLPDYELHEGAVFTGHVLETSVITNPVTGSSFCWAAVATLGGNIDVVADPILLNGLIVRGGVLTGSFWLSGVVLGL